VTVNVVIRDSDHMEHVPSVTSVRKKFTIPFQLTQIKNCLLISRLVRVTQQYNIHAHIPHMNTLELMASNQLFITEISLSSKPL
jgi:hypothetical protein